MKLLRKKIEKRNLKLRQRNLKLQSELSSGGGGPVRRGPAALGGESPRLRDAPQFPGARVIAVR